MRSRRSPSLERAKAEAMRELGEGDLFVLSLSDGLNEDIEERLPNELRYLFSRHSRIESLGAMNYIDYHVAARALDFPWYTFIGEDMEEPLLVAKSEDRIHIGCGPHTFRENYASLYHWILSVHD